MKPTAAAALIALLGVLGFGCAADEADEAAVVGEVATADDGDTSTLDSDTTETDDPSSDQPGDDGSEETAEADGGAGEQGWTMLGDESTLGDLSGVYANVVVRVVDVRLGRNKPTRLDPGVMELDPSFDDGQFVYIALDLENLDSVDWYDFPIGSVRLVVDGRPSEALNLRLETKRAEARAVNRYWYAFEYTGTATLDNMELVIADDTVPLVLPLAGPAPDNPYPVALRNPAPLSYLDGASSSNDCGARVELTVTDTVVDLQEPVDWEPYPRLEFVLRAETGTRLLIVKGEAERLADPSCGMTYSDVRSDYFRLVVDGRPTTDDGSWIDETRGVVGDVSLFEIQWAIPTEAESAEIVVTGSTGDTDSSVIDIGELPRVYGE